MLNSLSAAMNEGAVSVFADGALLSVLLLLVVLLISPVRGAAMEPAR